MVCGQISRFSALPSEPLSNNQGNKVANSSIRKNNLPVRILAYMADRDYRLSAVKIADGLGVERRAVTSALMSLKDREMVTSTGSGKAMIWGLSPEPVEIIGLDMASEPDEAVETTALFANGVPQFMDLVGHQYHILKG